MKPRRTVCRRQHVERARHEAEVAQHRFLRVHPDNRLVADALEAEWNARLREMAEAQATTSASARRPASARRRTARCHSDLATDVPRLWRDPRTSDRERKRLARLLLEDVTLLKTDHVTAHVRFKGGATRTLRLPLPVPIGLLRKTDPAIVAEIDQLLEDHTDAEIGAMLAERDVHTGGGVAFARLRVREVRLAYKLRSRYERLRARGYLTLQEMAQILHVGPQTVKTWRRRGVLVGEAGMIAATTCTHCTSASPAGTPTNLVAPRTAPPLCNGFQEGLPWLWQKLVAPI